MSSPANRGAVNNPVLPCENLDVEVVSDIIEELDDIEVIAAAKDDPDPDIDVRATLEKDTAAGAANPATAGANEPPPEPDYDVDVAALVAEEQPEPEIEVRALTQSSPVSGGPAPQAAPHSSEEAAGTVPPDLTPSPPEPDYDVDVSCTVKDAEEPDLELTCSITGDANEAAGGPPNG